MRKQSKINSNVLTFSKLSRKSFAVFVSLKRVIKIGKLKVKTCDLSFKKTVVVIKNTFISESFTEEGDANIKLSFDNLLFETTGFLQQIAETSRPHLSCKPSFKIYNNFIYKSKSVSCLQGYGLFNFKML